MVKYECNVCVRVCVCRKVMQVRNYDVEEGPGKLDVTKGEELAGVPFFDFGGY